MSESYSDQEAVGMENDVGALCPSSLNASIVDSTNEPSIGGQLPLAGSIEMSTSEAFLSDVAGFPKWIKPGLSVKAGRDPLGLQTITIDRIMPQLLPGILALSQRARYFSFYPFLLSEYQAHKLPPTNNELSTFIKAREYEYGLAVQLCSKGCGSRWSAVVGKNRVDPVVKSGTDPLPRGESVQSFLGGYGLYYRSPLIDLQVVAPLGTQLAATPTHVDVLRQEEWITALAGHFGNAIRDTAYYKQYFWGTSPIPVAVLREYAETACLCRLSEFPAEQEAIRNTLFTTRAEWIRDAVQQRRRSFALFLSVLAGSPAASQNEGVFRQAVIEHARPRLSDNTPEGDASSRWAALIMKEYMQEALSCIWTEVCRTGFAVQGPNGLTREEVQTLLQNLILTADDINIWDEPIQVVPDLPSLNFRDAVAIATRTRNLEDLRSWAAEQQTAIAGLVLLFATFDRFPDPAVISAGWTHIARQRSDNQPGLLALWRLLQDHVQAGETLATTLAWLTNNYIIQAHERIAYFKLPEFTFRFRWENGLLRFYDNGLERFELANIRRSAVAQISKDLGFWVANGDQSVLTSLGETFIQEVFG
ncbi:hypothetical protein KSF_063180 [Reticulibacter mediterranei]|uniref:Uncharacterized protein n=1 Tax=Reticulibacter mediterranei TaxID=2778369 RepID=A0A8J3IST8_9CHLR|nr:hypothetical protein [Reticulibacter mediterranei]GHO96270.1 hypothetical protein KSF_063180 [Reticulibacter mediterranei]